MAFHNGMNVLARRLRMFRRDPHCYWCGIQTVLGAEGQSNHATVDHLYSRLHPLRPTYHVAGSDRTAVLHVLSCAQCNQARGLADELGRVFVPELESRKEMAQLASATIGGEILRKYRPPVVKKSESPRPAKRALVPDDVRGFGWTDNKGDLRPRSWEEFCKYRAAFVGPAFERPPKPKRSTLCTIGEIIQWRS